MKIVASGSFDSSKQMLRAKPKTSRTKRQSTEKIVKLIQRLIGKRPCGAIE